MDFPNFSFCIQGWYRGPRPALYVTDPDFLKEVLIKESETFIDRPMLDRSDTIPHLINLKGMLTFCEKHLQIIFFKKRWNSFSNFMEVSNEAKIFRICYKSLKSDHIRIFRLLLKFLRIF